MKKYLFLLGWGLLSIAMVSAQWSIDSLTTPATYLLSGTTSSKVMFTNGGEWNIFDVTTNTHTSGMLTITRSMAEVVSYGEKIYVGGGKYGSYADPLYTKTVNVYNAATNSWSTLNLSKAREVGGAGAINNKVVFAGGTGRDFGGPVYLYNRVDIFDAVTGVRTTGKISKARSNIAAGAAGNKIVFAGGWYWDMMYNVLQSNAVDIYNTTTGTWTKTTLSKKRENISVAVVGNKIIFAGGAGGTYGGALKNVDVYDVATNTWTTSMLSVARYSMKSAVAGDKAFFAGGIGGPINSVEVYNATTNSWSLITIPVALSNFSMSSINGKIYFAGGYDEATATFSDLVQIYDPVANSWSTEYLSQARTYISAATIGGIGIFAGGNKAPSYPATYSNRVDFFLAPLREISEEADMNSKLLEVNIFPNPVTTEFQLVISDAKSLPVTCVIYDRIGHVTLSFIVTDISIVINVSDLPIGTYILSATPGSGNTVVKTFIKQ